MSSVTLVHPAKAVGWNEMSFGRDTRVIPSNILDRVPGLHGRGDLGVKPQFSAMQRVAKLLWLLLLVLLSVL